MSINLIGHGLMVFEVIIMVSLIQGWENAGIYELSPCHWRLLAFSGIIRHILACLGIS